MRNLLLAILSVTIFLGSYATAQASTTFVIVDEKVFEKAKVIQNIKTKIEAKRDEFQAEVKKEEEELTKEDEALMKQKDLVSKEVFEQQAKDFRQRFVEAQRLLQLRRTQLENAHAKTTQRVREEIQKIVQEMAKEKGFDIAVSKSILLYSDSSLDISEEVLEELDDRLPEIELIFSDEE